MDLTQVSRTQRRGFRKEEGEAFCKILAADAPDQAACMATVPKTEAEHVLFHQWHKLSPYAARVDAAVVLTCACIVKTVEAAWLWAWTLHRMAARHPNARLTLKDWLGAFGLGIPNEEAVSQMYRKVQLDSPSVWQVPRQELSPVRWRVPAAPVPARQSVVV